MNKFELKYYFFVVCFLTNFPGIGQENRSNFETIDKLTYKYYQESKWDSLILTSQQALKEGTDYFYLRVRTGIAYFNLENFRKSTDQFEKARSFNSSDPVLMEYLYLSYKYSNRNTEASKLFNDLPESLRLKLEPEKGKIPGELNLETGMVQNNNFNKNQHRYLAGNDSLYGEQDLNGNRYYLQAGFSGNIKSKVPFYFAYSYINLSKLKQVSVPTFSKTGFDTIPDLGWYYIDTIYSKNIKTTEDKYNLIQHQFYLNSKFKIGKFILLPSLNLINISYTTIFPQLSMEFAQSNDTVPSLPVYTFEKRKTTYTDYVASLRLSRSIGLTDISLRGSASNLNNKNQYQAEASATIFPKGNLNLYSHTSLIFQNQDQENSYWLTEKIGTRITSSIWSEFLFQFGEMKNFNENNGYLIHNSGDIMNYTTGLNVIIILSRNINASIYYKYFGNSASYVEYTGVESYNLKSFKYQNHCITGGLTWKL
ncbi:MAG: hypothetical protein K8R53_05180 [Bacteroidales bacterium]|nr:hypothetical protein [Bacteroidales bacterium]